MTQQNPPTAAEIQQVLAALQTATAGIATAISGLQLTRSTIDSALSGLSTTQAALAAGLTALGAGPQPQAPQPGHVVLPPDTWYKIMQG